MSGSKWDVHIEALRRGERVEVNVREFGYANAGNAYLAFKAIARRRDVRFARVTGHDADLLVLTP